MPGVQRRPGGQPTETDEEEEVTFAEDVDGGGVQSLNINISGARVSLLIGATAVLLAGSIGVLLGLLAELERSRR